MKKLFFLSVMAVMALTMNAQDAKDCTTHMQAKAERLAAGFGLDDAKKAEFTKTYVEYLTALKEAMPECKKDGKCAKGDCKKDGKCTKGDCKKDGKCEKGQCKHDGKCAKGEGLTDAEAKEMLDKRLECQQKRIEAAQKRLDVNKKFVAKFNKILTPQQTLKVMRIGKCKSHKMGRKGQMPGRKGMMKSHKGMKRGQMQHHDRMHQHHGMQMKRDMQCQKEQCTQTTCHEGQPECKMKK